jgi:hypothetical protein
MNDRQIHLSLVEQVADDANEAAAVRRILGEQLTEADLDAYTRWKMARPEPLNHDALAVLEVVAWCLVAWAAVAALTVFIWKTI